MKCIPECTVTLFQAAYWHSAEMAGERGVTDQCRLHPLLLRTFMELHNLMARNAPCHSHAGRTCRSGQDDMRQ